MANNYTEYSYMIDDLTPEQIDFAVDFRQALSTVDSDEPPTASDDALKLAREMYNEDNYDSATIHPDKDRGTIAIYSEESGDIDFEVKFLQGLLSYFDLDRGFGFTWAETCSKPRTDEFGGGAVYVTKDEVECMNTYEWLDDFVNPSSTN